MIIMNNKTAHMKGIIGILSERVLSAHLKDLEVGGWGPGKSLSSKGLKNLYGILDHT